MLSFLKNFSEQRVLKRLRREVAKINALEQHYVSLQDAELRTAAARLQEEARGGQSLDALLPRAFALVREVARRTLHQRPFDVQLMGGIVLHRGGVAEMVTGEGKTLAAVA
ncbi:preprotein translocase subunit SecA, partial [Candidatus Parcubacteria bacterium]